AGTTNRLLAPLASRVVAGFAGAFRQPLQYTVLGNPLRRALVQAAAASDYDFAGQRDLRLLVLGGSLGARPINAVLPGAVRALRAAGTALQVWHQAGTDHIEAVQTDYGPLLERGVRVAAFIEEMEQAYAWADLVVCRAGALTVSELAVMGRPAVLVPLPQAIDDHQSANARVLTDCGGAMVLAQKVLSADTLAGVLRELAAQPRRLSDMAAAARRAARPDATARVCDCCEELLHGH
ncbi:MAG: undecaprenyldiphospho-muramoylpentapeptide beta-N-acetylglucosaminyltransferase, partial [Halioglobus sp.]|nr:undecaprenyldiphospho-muramoylpentapeptide beta-N-acetylglucosaminyltransferase [Halioglobus sp.]